MKALDRVCNSLHGLLTMSGACCEHVMHQKSEQLAFFRAASNAALLAMKRAEGASDLQCMKGNFALRGACAKDFSPDASAWREARKGCCWSNSRKQGQQFLLTSPQAKSPTPPSASEHLLTQNPEPQTICPDSGVSEDRTPKRRRGKSTC